MNSHTPENRTSTPIDRDKPGWGLREAAHRNKQSQKLPSGGEPKLHRTEYINDTVDDLTNWLLWGLL